MGIYSFSALFKKKKKATKMSVVGFSFRVGPPSCLEGILSSVHQIKLWGVISC